MIVPVNTRRRKIVKTDCYSTSFAHASKFSTDVPSDVRLYRDVIVLSFAQYH